VRRFKNILVAASDPETTRPLLENAARLAELNDAQITLYDVINPVPSRRRFLQVGAGQVDVEQMLTDDHTEVLRELAAGVSPRVEVEVRSGTPFVEIIRRVESARHDLVMVSADSVGRRPGLAGAPTAMHLLRKCPVPVWADVGNGAGNSVAVGVGPFDRGSGIDSLNVTLMQLASSLALMRGGSLDVIHGWRLEGESLLRGPRMSSKPHEVDAMVEAVRRDASDAVEELLERVEVEVDVRVHLGKGMAGEVIPAFVEEHRPGVLVLGTVARTDIRGMIIGNTAERVLGTVENSILAVKPQGFVSPVS
jgi:nucleotide-binding universal stress UspA family protein